MPLQSYYSAQLLEAGCDEAGRGCLAGPVCAASVILPRNFYHPLLNDSKQVREEDREMLRQVIEQEAIAYGVCMQSTEAIDEINILNASFKAMHEAIGKLAPAPELLLIDGPYFPPYLGIAHVCIVKGDAKFTAIAAASILAKTYRDAYMLQLHEQYPEFGWDKNKGYGTAKHRAAIASLGITPHHRKSFGICNTAFDYKGPSSKG
jgi:ribonuclease HII